MCLKIAIIFAFADSLRALYLGDNEFEYLPKEVKNLKNLQIVRFRTDDGAFGVKIAHEFFGPFSARFAGQRFAGAAARDWRADAYPRAAHSEQSAKCAAARDR